MIEFEILRFLKDHSDGEYQSRDLLAFDFSQKHPEYSKKSLDNAVDKCFGLGFIRNHDYPSYVIYLTDKGRNQIRS